jgi:hypothetical protein
MMTSIRAKPARRPAFSPRVGGPSLDVRHDPARLSTTLRELALRAHRAVRAAEIAATRPGAVASLDPDSRQELVDVHARIVQLDRSLRAQSLDGLVPYVSALREKIASVIGQ